MSDAGCFDRVELDRISSLPLPLSQKRRSSSLSHERGIRRLMTKQNQTTGSKEDNRRRRIARQESESGFSDQALGPDGALAGLLLQLGGASGESPANELTSPRWQDAQRIRATKRLARLHGNQQLQRAFMEPANPPAEGPEAKLDRPSRAEGPRESLPADRRDDGDSPPPRTDNFRNGEDGRNLTKIDAENGPERRVTFPAPDQPDPGHERSTTGPDLGDDISIERAMPHSSDVGIIGNQGVLQRQGAGGTGGASAPIPALPEPDRRRDFALDVLKKAYGGLIKQESKVIGAPNESLLRVLYDQSMIAMGRVFIEEDGTERPWVPGDSRKHPDMSSELSGFYDPSSKQVYIDLGKKPDAQVATLVHEILHANSSPDFGATLGKDLDEGMTEKLTQKAFAKSGYTPPSGFFAGQVGVVEKLGSIVGPNTLKYAYFNGTGGLRSMMDAKLEEGVFERFALEVRNKNWAWLNKFFDRYARAVQGTETEKKIAVINSLLDGWVSDTDLDNIENIWSASSAGEKAEIRKAVSPRIGSLIDIGQRTRLRTILAS